MRKSRPARALRRFLFYLSLFASAVFIIYPIICSTLEGFDADLSPLFSGKGITYVGGVPFYSGGFHPNIANLIDAFQLYAFPRLVQNSTIISSMSVLIALGIGIPAGYFLARSRLPGREYVGFMILALRTASPFVILVPLYLLYVHHGLWDTYIGMAVAYLAIDLPVVIWMLRSFFADVPQQVYEAAEVSGASERQIFWRVSLPMVAAGIVATAIFAFVLVWNEFLLADFLTGGATKTVSVGIWTGAGEAIGGFRNVEWDTTNLYGVLSFLPVFVLILAIKKYLARGFSLATGR